MKDMKTIARMFANDHIGKGVVSHITDYSFMYTTTPKNEKEKQVSTVYMLSYFMEI